MRDHRGATLARGYHFTGDGPLSITFADGSPVQIVEGYVTNGFAGTGTVTFMEAGTVVRSNRR